MLSAVQASNITHACEKIRQTNRGEGAVNLQAQATVIPRSISSFCVGINHLGRHASETLKPKTRHTCCRDCCRGAQPLDTRGDCGRRGDMAAVGGCGGRTPGPYPAGCCPYAAAPAGG